MKRMFTILAMVGLLTMALASPALASIVACQPPQPPPGTTLECSVSNAEGGAELAWVASFEDGTEVTGDVATDDEGQGAFDVGIPDDPELAGTQFTVEVEDGGTYTGIVGAPEEEDEAEAAEETDEADETDATEEDDDAVDADEQVTERPEEDTEVALGAGGAAGTPTLALLVAALGVVLAVGAGGYLVRAGVRR